MYMLGSKLLDQQFVVILTLSHNEVEGMRYEKHSYLSLWK